MVVYGVLNFSTSGVVHIHIISWKSVFQEGSTVKVDLIKRKFYELRLHSETFQNLVILRLY